MRRRSFPVIIALAFLIINVISYGSLFFRHFLPSLHPRNPLDGCKHVYLDVGTNIGIQIRKLYEPHLYKGADIHEYFYAFFGDLSNRRASVCAVGFEPNIKLETHLKNLQDAHNRCGFRTLIFTRTAVSHKTEINGASFHTRGHVNGIGGTILNVRGVKKATKQSVNLIRLSDFIQNTVLTRAIPHHNDGLAPGVLMKMDIEGSEATVVLDLVLSGVFPSINLTLIEWHKFKDANYKTNIQIKNAQNMLRLLKYTGEKYDFVQKIEWMTFDDETFFNSKYPFPIC